MPEKISVVIPNWNGARWLPTCLDSLARQSFRDFKIYVVDNGSTDGSVTLMETRYPDVEVIQNSENLGFAGGMNVGFRAAQGELLAALNNDVEVDSEWLAVVARTMDACPQAGFAASQLMDFQNRNIIDSLGDGFYPFGLSFKIGAGKTYRATDEKVLEIQSACAAASIYRSSMLQEIGLFDTDFFAYMEDIDLGLRAQMAGYNCIFIPGAKVFHIGSATSGGQASAFSIRLTVRNTYQVILKNVPLVLVPVYVLLTLLAQIAALLVSFVPGKLDWLAKHRNALLKGWGGALMAAPGSLKKRASFRHLRKRGSRDFLRSLKRSVQLNRSI